MGNHLAKTGRQSVDSRKHGVARLLSTTSSMISATLKNMASALRMTRAHIACQMRGCLFAVGVLLERLAHRHDGRDMCDDVDCDVARVFAADRGGGYSTVKGRRRRLRKDVAL